MNASERSEVLRETDHVKEHGGNPGVDALRQEHRPDEPNSPRDPVRHCVLDECAGETFVGGAGI